MKILKILTTALLVAAFFSTAAFASEDRMNYLKEGNARYVQEKMLHPNQNSKTRKDIAPSQKPKAVVLSCSDSRLPPEIIFDQGLGDLFVVRVAGNVLNKENLGSIEYAVEHLGVKDIVVIGHSRCGAVTAAVKGGEVHGPVKSIINALEPAVKEAKKQQCGKCDLVELASHINVKNIVKELGSHFKANVFGAYYDLDSGKVEFLEE